MTIDPSKLFTVLEPAPLTVRDRMRTELRTMMDTELRTFTAESHTRPEGVETARQDSSAIHPDAAEEPSLPPSAKHESESVNTFGEPSTMAQPSAPIRGSRARCQRLDDANPVHHRDRGKPYARKTLAQHSVASHTRHNSMPPLVESDEIEDATSSEGAMEGESESSAEIGERSG